jgi:hypothetical protein
MDRIGAEPLRLSLAAYPKETRPFQAGASPSAWNHEKILSEEAGCHSSPDKRKRK